MAVKITEYLRPGTLREASDILERHGRDGLVIGGGVSVVLSGSPRPMHAVDLSNLGLNRIERCEDGLRLGAMVSLEDLIQSPVAGAVWTGLLPEACRTAATKAVRDLITVGGNIVQCYYWSTLPPLLLAVEGRITVAGRETSRDVPAVEFFRSHPRKRLSPGEIVTAVEIPVPPVPSAASDGLRWGAAFLKFAKTHNDYGMVNACAVVGIEGGADGNASGGAIREIRLALGALDTLPVRCAGAEAALTGAAFDEGRAREACAAAVANLGIREDFRASTEYRRRVAAVYLHRALAEAWRRATDPAARQPVSS